MSSRKSLSCWARVNLRRMDRLSGCIRAMFRASRPDDGQTGGGVALAVARLVFVHRHVEHPVQAVLDRPVGADGAPETLGRGLGAEQIIAAVDALRAVGETPLGDHFAEGGKTGPVVALPQPVDVVADRRRALLDAPRGPCQPVDATGVSPIRAGCPDTPPRPRAASPGCPSAPARSRRPWPTIAPPTRAARAAGVRRHRSPLHVHQLQQLRQRRDLVRLAVHLQLRQRQFRLRRERLQQVRRRPFRGVLERPPQHLAGPPPPRRRAGSAQSCAKRSSAV